MHLNTMQKSAKCNQLISSILDISYLQLSIKGKNMCT